MRPGAGQLSAYALDNFVAHKLSQLTVCGAPELLGNAGWLNTFILTTIFRVQLKSDLRAYLFNFIRRAEAACSAYRHGRAAIGEYLGSPPMTLSPYFTALAQFEVCVGQCYQAHELLGRAVGERVFEEGDNSPAERLHAIYVDSKHMDRMIAGSKLPSEATSAVWVTNTGLGSARSSLTFNELHVLLVELRRTAERLAALVPPEAPPT